MGDLSSFGKCVWAVVRDENVDNGSLLKQNNSLEKIPTTVEVCSVITLPTAHTGLLTAIPPPHLAPHYTQNEQLKVY